MYWCPVMAVCTKATQIHFLGNINNSFGKLSSICVVLVREMDTGKIDGQLDNIQDLEIKRIKLMHKLMLY